MIRLSVLYPSGEGSTFDHDYYRDHHTPLAVKNWAPVAYQIDRGIDGPYVAALHLIFESGETLGAALAGPGTAELQADMANYTNITPVLQTSEMIDV